jgi:drug/metabolite transporter (DMT)-like permease
MGGRMTSRHLVVLLIGVVAISWAAPLIRLADDVPAIVIAAVRLGLAAPPMVAIAAWTGQEQVRTLRRSELLVLLLSGVALAAHFGFWVASLQLTSVLSSVALVTMQPIFVALGAWLFLRERPSRAVMVGIALGTLGAVVLFAEDLGDVGSLTGNAYAVIGAIAASIYLVAGRGARRRLSMPVYTAGVYSVTAVVLFAVVVATRTPVTGYAPESYAFLVLLALVPQLIGHNALNWALGAVPAAIVAVAVLGEPVGAAILAFILLDEMPTLLEIAGGTLLLSGVYMALRGAARREPVREVYET